MLREMRPALREQQYGEALMARGPDASAAASPRPRASPSTPARRAAVRALPADGAIPWPLLLGRRGAALLFSCCRRRGRARYGGGGGGFLPGLILGNMMGRSSWGGRGGGGFGGYDSGDSFGGFGGGDSGGGGASSDW